VLVAGAVAAVALTGGGSGGTTADRSTSGTGAGDATSKQSDRTASTQGSTPRHSTAQQPQPTTATQAQSAPGTTSTAPPPASGGDPKDLNNRGFALMQQGNPAAAVPLLQQAVQSFRQQGRTGEIDYAFALYNLGASLRATGHPADAIPLLEERLRVSNYKRGIVRQELAAARQQAGQGAPSQGGGKQDKRNRDDSSGPGPGRDGH
jgi:tetratricopeptide (TPR) repeat protein